MIESFFFFQFKYLKRVSLIKKNKKRVGWGGKTSFINKKTKNVLGGVGLIGYWGVKIGCWRRKGGGGGGGTTMRADGCSRRGYLKSEMTAATGDFGRRRPFFL